MNFIPGADEQAGLPADGHIPPSRLSPLVLAYVGDSVYELFVRSMLAQKQKGSVHKLHTEATKYSRCASQSDVVLTIMGELTEAERDVVRRGRNTNSGYVPKNADITEYRYATGFEALLGFMYLNRDYDRLTYILNLAVKHVADRETKQK